MENDQENTCENCKYFVQYYIKKKTIFYATFKGYCSNSEILKIQKRKPFVMRKNCEYWESDESVKAERRQHIKHVLRNMCKQIHEIEMILKDDE